jgi:outer membrane protein TolC
LQNFGFGNRALVRERRGEQQQQQIEFFRLQDLVASQIAEAHVQVQSANKRIVADEMGLPEAELAYQGSILQLGEVERVGETTMVVRRAFEVIDALRALSQAYNLYFASVNDYNRAQVRPYRALGCPAEILSCEQPAATILPVDTTRPPPMAPVCRSNPSPRP